MIRKIEEKDKDEYLSMAKDFYSSPAVLHTVANENFQKTFEELMRSDVYAEGFIFEKDGKTAGYALIANTFSQEAGGKVCWIEEIYVKPEFRSEGLGTEFFGYLEKIKSDEVKRFRLEVEIENERAIGLYTSLGYDFFGYDQMVKEV